MATIDKNKFQFVKRDDFASEVIAILQRIFILEICIQDNLKEPLSCKLAILIGILLDDALSTLMFS